MLFRFFGCYKTIIKDTLEKAKIDDYYDKLVALRINRYFSFNLFI